MFLILIYIIVGLCVIYSVALIIQTFKNDECQDEQPKQIKQELTDTDYMMVLDSMLIFGIINSNEYNSYITQGMPYFTRRAK